MRFHKVPMEYARTFQSVCLIVLFFGSCGLVFAEDGVVSHETCSGALRACSVMAEITLTLQPQWDQAIASYDPLSMAMWLEFDVHGIDTPSVCLCGGGVGNNNLQDEAWDWSALVEFDGAIVASVQDTEAGFMLQGVGLGRHWGELIVVDCAGKQLAAALVEFVLPFHSHVTIVHPQNREIVTPGQDTTLCFHMVPAADCLDGCMSDGPASVSVDGIPVAVLPSVSREHGGTCVVLPSQAITEGRHLVTVHMTGIDGYPIGPMSNMHHLVAARGDPHRAGYFWMRTIAEIFAESLVDLIIDTGVWGADTEGHGVFINPCIYGDDASGLRVVFREHQLKEQGPAGYKMRLEPSVQWEGTLLWNDSASTLMLDPHQPPRRLGIACGGPPALEGAVGPQDARIVKLNDDAFVWFNANSQQLPSRVTQQYIILDHSLWGTRETHTDKISLKAPIEVQVSNQIVEKNFVPFEWGGKVMFAYSVEPHIIYELDPDTGGVALMSSTSNKKLAEALSAGDLWLHGGTPALKIHRQSRLEYLSVCHTKEPDFERYRNFAYTFSAEPPFQITGWSRALQLAGKIQMAVGIMLAQGGGMWGAAGEDGGDVLVVSYGSEDKHMRVASFDLKQLVDSMEEI